MNIPRTRGIVVLEVRKVSEERRVWYDFRSSVTDQSLRFSLMQPCAASCSLAPPETSSNFWREPQTAMDSFALHGDICYATSLRLCLLFASSDPSHDALWPLRSLGNRFHALSNLLPTSILYLKLVLSSTMAAQDKVCLLAPATPSFLC